MTKEEFDNHLDEYKNEEFKRLIQQKEYGKDIVKLNVEKLPKK